MYDDLVSGALGSPGLVDAATSLGATAASYDTQTWIVIRAYIRQILVFAIDLMQTLSLWIRDTPIVLAVIAILFTGFVVGIFMRVYKGV